MDNEEKNIYTFILFIFPKLSNNSKLMYQKKRQKINKSVNNLVIVGKGRF